MAKEIYRQNVWYGGMTNDDNIGQPGSSYDIQGIDVKKNTKSFGLGFNGGDAATRLYDGGGSTVAIMKGNFPYELYLSSNGNIYGYGAYTNGDLYQTTGTIINGSLIQFVQLGINNTSKYGMYINNTNKLSRWIFDPAAGGVNNDMGLCDSNINPNTTWASPWVTTGWTINSTQVQHNTGNTSYLSIPLTVTNAKKYRINVKVNSLTAGTCDVYMGGANLGTISVAGGQSFYRTTTSTSETLEFRPTTTCTIKIDSVSICKSLVEEDYLTLDYSASGPILQSLGDLYIGGYGTVMRIDISTNTWVELDTLIIDPGYTVVAMTEIGDQVIVYASNGSIGKQYFWDGVSGQVDRVINWYDKPIQNVANLNNVDYVITGTDGKKQLFVASGYQPEKLYSSKYLVGSNAFVKYNFAPTYTNSIETLENLIFIPDLDGNIYVYGSRIPGIPATIQRELSVPGIVTAIYATEDSSGPRITVAFRSSTIDNVLSNYVKTFYYYNYSSYDMDDEYNTINSFGNVGTLTTNPFFGDAAKYTEADKKQGSKIRIGYKLPRRTNAITGFTNYIRGITTTYADYKYRINLYQTYDDNDGGNNYITFYVGGFTTIPTVGAIYSFGSNQYTIESVEQLTVTTYKGAYIVAKMTTNGGSRVNDDGGTLTKVSGTGDNTLIFQRFNKGKLIKSLTDTTIRSLAFQYNQLFHKIQYRIELLSLDGLYTPTIKSFDLIYDQVQNDLI